jgi:hypothetical protein
MAALRVDGAVHRLTDISTRLEGHCFRAYKRCEFGVGFMAIPNNIRQQTPNAKLESVAPRFEV